VVTNQELKDPKSETISKGRKDEIVFRGIRKSYGKLPGEGTELILKGPTALEEEKRGGKRKTGEQPAVRGGTPRKGGKGKKKQHKLKRSRGTL